MASIWKAVGTTGTNQAHNGYLEQYLNLGYVGVGFIIAIVLSALVNVRKHLTTDYAAGVLRLCFVVVAMLYNYTEASFYGINNIWLLLLASSFDRSGISASERSVTVTPSGRPSFRVRAEGQHRPSVMPWRARSTRAPSIGDRLPVTSLKRRQR